MSVTRDGKQLPCGHARSHASGKHSIRFAARLKENFEKQCARLERELKPTTSKPDSDQRFTTTPVKKEKGETSMPDHNHVPGMTQHEKDGMELLRRTSVDGNAAQQAAPPRPVRDRAELVMEIAMRQRFRERKRQRVERPTIEQLEKMLNGTEPPDVDILPDGSVLTTEERPIFICDLLKSALDALYEDGFEIIDKK